jgi:cyclophilin family peptidyl-prolyl cis-trans isomerase
VVSHDDLKKRRVHADGVVARQASATQRKARRRRVLISMAVGLLAVTMVLPLVSGLILVTGDSQEPDVPVVPLDTTPPSLVSEGYEGLTLTGETPCPAIDGSQARTTSFATAPPDCLEPATEYTIQLETLSGEVAVELDPTTSPEATNLIVALARYGVYESAPLVVYDGLVLVGGAGDAGFTISSDPAPADGSYPIGSVIALADLQGSLPGQFAIVTGELGAQALAVDPVHPIIGTVRDGLDVFDRIYDLVLSNPTTPYRLRAAVVTQNPAG